MFEPVAPDLDLVSLESAVLDRWRRDDVFGESLRRREGAPDWVFYEGPPTANGQPGIHHVWARLFKDIFPRFHTMRGKRVLRKGGWDCHGLPVEVQVEKELGFSGKPQILEYGIEEFNQRCRASVQRYVEDWQSLTSRIGMWLDIKDAYWTLSNEYIETVWWLFHEMWDNGDIYEGFKVVPYCGRCGTALSSHELGQPGAYRDVTEPSIYARFPVRERDFDLVVWTTTPWTLPSNVAAAVGPQVRYVRVRDPHGGRDLVLGASRVTDVLGDDAEVVGPVAVEDLVGLHYERPFDFVALDGELGSVIVAADFVSDDDGSGIVHLAPAFGEIDREVSEAHGLPVLNPVNENARFTDAMPLPYRGQFVKDADAALIERLRAEGRAVRVADYTHSYPHCWRCDTPLIYWAKPTWFARTASHRDALLRENESVNWYPEHIKHGRFGHWLEGNVDWALSRDRFWGTPIPVWRCRSCAHDVCIGSLERLAELADRDLTGLDLHRPYVDDIVVRCPECGGRAHRVDPVLDAWFDSGSMPAAQLHYPFENADEFPQRFPADFICEAIDQTRGWFYSLLAVNTLVFNRAPYRNVVCLAHIIDQDGLKMSKSRGNVIDPWSVLSARGAEALRWYMFSSGSPWTPKRVSVDAIDESTKFLRTLWNTLSFFVTYANLDGWTPQAGARSDHESSHVLDRWILSRLHGTTATVTDALENFDALAGAQAIGALVDDMSNWYVRRSRPRFWKAADTAAPATLHECLTTIALLLAPYCPFLADELHRLLTPTADGGAGAAGLTASGAARERRRSDTGAERAGERSERPGAPGGASAASGGGNESVHLLDWPTADERRIDRALEDEMAIARAITSLGRSARADAKLGVRQPLSRAIVSLPAGTSLRAEVSNEVESELNVKHLEPVDSLEGLITYHVAPNFRALGPRVGKLLPALKAELASLDGADAQRALATVGLLRVDVGGTTIELGPDDVEVRAEKHEELSLVQGGGLAVALDLRLDDELRAEGIARELVRAINDGRKQGGFAIADRIACVITTSGPVAEAARTHGAYIATEVLATSYDVATGEPTDADLTIDGIGVSLELGATSVA